MKRINLDTVRRVVSHAADLAGVMLLLAVFVFGFPWLTLLLVIGAFCLVVGWGLDR